MRRLAVNSELNGKLRVNYELYGKVRAYGKRKVYGTRKVYVKERQIPFLPYGYGKGHAEFLSKGVSGHFIVEIRCYVVLAW